jgi:Tol biopolymer transport system component
MVDGRYIEAENVGAPVNTEHREFDPCIAPDGSFLLFISNRPGSPDREYDMYVSFRSQDDAWSEPRAVGSALGKNPGLPTLTSDGRFLFFVGNFSSAAEEWNIYWVDAKVLDPFRPRDSGAAQK